MKQEAFILESDKILKEDAKLVGGKTSNLGELINKVKVLVPDFFAITTEAYDYFLKEADLFAYIKEQLDTLNLGDLTSLQEVGSNIRRKIKYKELPDKLKKEIVASYEVFSRKFGEEEVNVAVRSSATAEDLEDASFAGQQDTYLNVKGANELLEKVKHCFASLYTDRAISYREQKGFNHLDVKLSVVIQKLVNSEASGVAFTIDPDSGFKNVVTITGSWGLGEYIVQGKVTPDEFVYFKPTKKIISKKLGSKELKLVKAEIGYEELVTSEAERQMFILNMKQVLELAKYCEVIEKHYGKAMDIEWALDGDTGKLFIVQARPETVETNKDANLIKKYYLKEKSTVMVEGKSVGRKIVSGKVRVIENVKNIHNFKPNEILVTTMTDPDWEPIMKIANGIITDLGGSTSHAAIISRELGIPTIVGSSSATKALKTGDIVTIDCTRDVGKVWINALNYEVKENKIDNIPKTRTKIMLNLGDPESAFDAGQLPVDGIALARQEFIISNYIREHPLFMIKQGRGQEFSEKLSQGIARIAAAFYPREVILRTSDFKTNEYRGLKGGKEFEPKEENPMIGWRGVSRYINPQYTPAFKLEIEAIKHVRNDLGLTNISLLIPFCRTIEEGKKMFEILKENGLNRGDNGLKVYLMAEIPSNLILFDEFAELFDGFSIGSNDLTQLTLGIDRDSTLLIDSFDERNPAVLKSIKELIEKCKKKGKYIGICGNAPSNYPEYAKLLVSYGIDSMGLTPDVVLETKLNVAKFEKELDES